MAMTSLDSTRLAFLDVETTGLSPAMGDRIVEIGVVDCQQLCHLLLRDSIWPRG